MANSVSFNLDDDGQLPAWLHNAEVTVTATTHPWTGDEVVYRLSVAEIRSHGYMKASGLPIPDEAV
jgi:hypothetical protein